jgi:hypothetical protein
MSCCSSQSSICPCGQFIHPSVISNVAGLADIAYRAGDYTTFRHALLRALPGEAFLTSTVNGQITQIWHPGAEGDLAVQMMEWWAYLADILTFYNERNANQAYLRTASLPETVNRLVRLLGYRPRPGIGAKGVLAALMNVTIPFALPQGFQIQSKAGPGQQPQIFELDQTTTIAQPDVIPVDPAPLPGIKIGSGTVTALLKGVISGVKIGDQLLLLEKGWAGSGTDYAIGSIQGVTPGKDPRGNAYSQITLAQVVSGSDFPAPGAAESAVRYRLLKSSQSTSLYQYSSPADWVSSFTSTFRFIPFIPPIGIDFTVVSQDPSLTASGLSFIDLQSVVRQIKSGDPLLFEDPSPGSTTSPQMVSVNGVTELIYYANNPSEPETPPTSTRSKPVAGIAMPHTQVSFTPGLGSPWSIRTALIRYAWQDVGQLTDQMATDPSWNQDPASGSSQLAVSAADGASFASAGEPENAFLEDSVGNGAETGVTAGSDAEQEATLTVPPPNSPPAQPPASLSAPLRLLLNLIPVSRGKTVAGEILGSGNAAVSGQDFTLQNSPVTYFQDASGTPRSGDGFSSTVHVRVNGIEWTEVPSLYGQPPNAQVFITKEDDQGRTHVVFGAARPPTGAAIVANYRYGSGADAPAAGSLTTILQPLPGLQAIRNPVAVGGGGDPDSPDKVRQLAPRSVLTFGRAISVDDLEAISLGAPGVTRVKAEVAFDPLAQRPRITVWVGDTDAAVASAQAAISGAADPNRMPKVAKATRIRIKLSATLVIDPRYDSPSVVSAAQSALLDTDTGLGLFGVNRIGISESVYDSQIYAACTVAGVLSVKDLAFTGAFHPIFGRPILRETNFFRPATLPQCTDHRHDPGDGRYFFLDPENLNLNPA